MYITLRTFFSIVLKCLSYWFIDLCVYFGRQVGCREDEAQQKRLMAYSMLLLGGEEEEDAEEQWQSGGFVR